MYTKNACLNQTFYVHKERFSKSDFFAVHKERYSKLDSLFDVHKECLSKLDFFMYTKNVTLNQTFLCTQRTLL
jgi:hypothetical protein